jgi:hypothetical protein
MGEYPAIAYSVPVHCVQSLATVDSWLNAILCALMLIALAATILSYVTGNDEGDVGKEDDLDD